MNCRSVAFSALSGMLLTSAIVSSPWPARSGSLCAGASAGLAIGLSNGGAMFASRALFRRLQRGPRGRFRERLVDVLDDIGDVLDADRETDGLGQHTGHALLLG